MKVAVSRFRDKIEKTLYPMYVAVSGFRDKIEGGRLRIQRQNRENIISDEGGPLRIQRQNRENIISDVGGRLSILTGCLFLLLSSDEFGQGMQVHGGGQVGGSGKNIRIFFY